MENVVDVHDDVGNAGMRGRARQMFQLGIEFATHKPFRLISIMIVASVLFFRDSG